MRVEHRSTSLPLPGYSPGQLGRVVIITEYEYFIFIKVGA